MKGSHIHVGVKNFKAAADWMEHVWNLRPAFSNDRMAVFPVGGFSVILDKSTEDTEATVAFDSQDCTADYKEVTARGAETIDAPAEQPWGVKVAYIRGPGRLTFEIEQVLKKS